MSQNTSEKISADDVEVINTSSNPAKITKVRVDDENTSNSSGTPSVEEFLKTMNGQNQTGENSQNPMMDMLGNMAEIKKIKIYFLFAVIFGFWALFGLREYMAPLALFFGILDLLFGSKLTKKASMIGMIFALIGLALEFG